MSSLSLFYFGFPSVTAAVQVEAFRPLTRGLRWKWESRALILLLPPNLLFVALNFPRLPAPDRPGTSLDHSVSCALDSLTSSSVYRMAGEPHSQICLTVDFLCVHTGWPSTTKEKSSYPDSQWNVSMGILSLVLCSPVLPIPLITVSKDHLSLQDSYLTPYTLPTRLPGDNPLATLSIKWSHGGMKSTLNSCLAHPVSVSC